MLIDITCLRPDFFIIIKMLRKHWYLNDDNKLSVKFVGGFCNKTRKTYVRRITRDL